MNNLLSCSLIALGTVASGMSAQAQTKLTVTTSTNAVPTPLSSPAIQPDTLQPNRPGMNMPTGDDKDTRINRKLRRKNHSKVSPADTINRNDYRQDAGNGTAINNSNTTNYNSQNAIAPATGVNALPPMTGAVGAGSGNGSVTTGSTMGAPAQTGSTAVSKAPTPGEVADPDRNGTKANRSKTLTVSDFIAGSPNYTTLQNALQTATLDKSLKSAGPFTVFAPSNEAFKKLPPPTQTVLLEGKNVDALKTLLTYHVIAGEVDAAELTRRIKSGNGKASLETVSGGTLTARMTASGQVSLTDEQGNTTAIDTPDFYQLNGVVHGIGNVLLPKTGITAFR